MIKKRYNKYRISRLLWLGVLLLTFGASYGQTTFYVTDRVMGNSGSLDVILASAVSSANAGNNVTVYFNVAPDACGNTLCYVNQELTNVIPSAGSILLKSDPSTKDPQGIEYDESCTFVRAFYSSGSQIRLEDVSLKISSVFSNCSSGKCPVLSSFDESTEKGIISVDLSEITDKVAPYHYQLSDRVIEDFHAQYVTLRDTLFKDSVFIDSSLFYTGKEINETFQFQDIKSGEYYLSVFDNRGVRIVNRQFKVLPSLTLSENSSVSFYNGGVIANAANAKAVLNLYLNDGEDAAISFRLSDASATQFMGVMDYPSALVDKYSLRYGFSVSGNIAKFVQDGTENSRQFTVSNSSVLSIVKQNGEILYYIDGLIVNNLTPGSIPYLKSVVGMTNSGTSVTPVPMNLTKKFFHLKAKVLNNFQCGGQTGSFTFGLGSVYSLAGLNFTITSATLEGNAYSGLNGSYSAATIHTAQVAQVGNYVINGNIIYNGSTYYFSTTISIGYETVWEAQNRIYYDLNPNAYSLYRTNVAQTPLTYSTAQSTNTLAPIETGWIELIPVTETTTGDSYISLLNGTNSGVPFYSSEIFLRFKKVTVLGATKLQIVGSYPVNGQAYGFVKYVQLNSKITIKVNAADVVMLANGVPITNIMIPRPAGQLFIKANSGKYTDGLKNILTTFKCSQNFPASTNYWILSDEMIDRTAYVNDGKIRIKFEEDYFDVNGTLSYSISKVSDQNTTVATGTVTKPSHTNWITIDIGANGLNLPASGKVYLLQVVDVNGNKKYLKVKHQS